MYVKMFTIVVFAFVMIASSMVSALYPEEKINLSDLMQENPEISAFLLHDIIRLNITWKNNVFDDGDIADILIVNSDNNANCYYSYAEADTFQDNTIIFPDEKMDSPEAEAKLQPGCSYNIYVNIWERTFLNYSYRIADCIENYCVCNNDLIEFLNVEYMMEDDYIVRYSPGNSSQKKDEFRLTDIVCIEDRSKVIYRPIEAEYDVNCFKIHMPFLNYNETYTLYISYKDINNTNPMCEHTTYLRFTTPDIEQSENFATIAIIIFSIILTILFIYLLFTRLQYLKRKDKTNEILKLSEDVTASLFKCKHQEVNILYSPMSMPKTEYIDPYECQREQIIIKDVIGEGAFGKVFYAKAYEINGLPGYTMVAVKLLRGDAPKEEIEDFHAEINMLKKIGVHKNIVKMLGCVTRSQPYMMIMELISTGDLKEYLLKLREIWNIKKNKSGRHFFPYAMDETIVESYSIIKHDPCNIENSLLEPPQSSPSSVSPLRNLTITEDIICHDFNTKTPLLADVETRPNPVLNHKELENFAYQIADGMAYLEKIPVTHRDLAARNILITNNKILKISDFGMSRNGPYVKQTTKKVPLRWMAIEAIEYFETDSKSDVWSFGVVLWEIGTLGAFPYEHIPNNLILLELKSGTRLPRPEICTDELYDLMKRCWMENPNDRPTFRELVETLDVKKNHAYVDFEKINPKYVFPPTDT